MPPARIALAAIIQRQFNASEPAALVAVVVIIADIDPLRSVRGPNPAPAIVVASVEVVSAANESEAIEAIMMVMEEGWVMCERCAREGRRKCGTRHWHGGETSRADLWSYAHWVPNHAHGVRPRHATHAVAGADPRRGTNAMSAAQRGCRWRGCDPQAREPRQGAGVLLDFAVLPRWH